MHRNHENHDHPGHHPIARLKRFMARHHGRHGGGGRFGGFGDGFGGSFGSFMAGRKLGARDLELAILALLAEQPLHGYKIIKELEERSKGFYVPSPGMIYPSLAFLEETGRVVGEAEGVKKLYRLTDEGRAHLEANRNEANALLAQLAFIGGKMEHLREAFAEEDGGDLHDAAHVLRAAVRGKRHATPDERKRVAEILKRAAKEILGN